VKGQGLLPRCGGWQLLKLCLCQRPDHISLCINRSLIQGNYTTQRYLAVKLGKDRDFEVSVPVEIERTVERFKVQNLVQLDRAQGAFEQSEAHSLGLVICKICKHNEFQCFSVTAARTEHSWPDDVRRQDILLTSSTGSTAHRPWYEITWLIVSQIQGTLNVRKHRARILQH